MIYVRGLCAQSRVCDMCSFSTQAAAVVEEGLHADPNNKLLKAALDSAIQGMLTDMVAGRNLDILALPATAASTAKRITAAPYSAATLSLLRSECTEPELDVELPSLMMTPRHFLRDDALKDAYEFVTVQVRLVIHLCLSFVMLFTVDVASKPAYCTVILVADMQPTLTSS